MNVSDKTQYEKGHYNKRSQAAQTTTGFILFDASKFKAKKKKETLSSSDHTDHAAAVYQLAAATGLCHRYIPAVALFYSKKDF